MVWGTQADVNSLYHVLPNMKEFDVHVGRGYTPVESYGRLLARFLEVAPENVARYASVLDAPRLHAGSGTGFAAYLSGDAESGGESSPPDPAPVPVLTRRGRGGKAVESKVSQWKVVGLASFSGGGGSGPDGQCFHDVFCRLLG